jgi:putative SOS response-associated peptidase YedK
LGKTFMCGRYSLTSPVESLRRLFQFDNSPNLGLRVNIAPTQEVAAVRTREGTQDKREIALLRWGLIPSWAKSADMSAKMINARSETVAEKPAFRSAFRKRRCLIPADGFFEWHSEAGGKQPYRVVRRDGEPMAFAGLWENWREPGSGEEITSCAILTTEASKDIAHIHHRMPVILEPDEFSPWLDPSSDRSALQKLLHTLPEGKLKSYPVSKAINKVANDDPKLLEPIELSAGPEKGTKGDQLDLL